MVLSFQPIYAGSLKVKRVILEYLRIHVIGKSFPWDSNKLGSYCQSHFRLQKEDYDTERERKLLVVVHDTAIQGRVLFTGDGDNINIQKMVFGLSINKH